MRTSRRALACFVAVAVAGAPAERARAEEIEVNYVVDGAIAGAATLFYVLAETVLKDSLAPSACRWCDDDVNGLDRAVRDAVVFDDASQSHEISNYTAYVMTPAVAFVLLAGTAASEDQGRNWPTDALAVYEAAILSTTLNELVKITVARRRPYVTFGNPTAEGAGNDAHQSFYSGHTSFAFALAVASGTVASVRGYRAAPAVWAAGLTFATTTGYLRLAADRHYFTDVLTGALMGSAMGFALPYFLHRKKDADAPTVSIMPGGVTLTMRW